VTTWDKCFGLVDIGHNGIQQSVGSTEYCDTHKPHNCFYRLSVSLRTGNTDILEYNGYWSWTPNSLNHSCVNVIPLIAGPLI